MKRLSTTALALGAALAASAPAGAVTTKSWELGTYKAFDEGEANGVRIGSTGQVRPGRDTTRVAVTADSLWTAVRGADGTIYAGTLDKGEILAISGGKVRTLASLAKETPWIGALATGGRGTLYAGTVATGSVYAVDTASGKTTLLCKLDDAEHVWALVTSADGKTLYAATGASGKLFAIDLASKKARVLWDAEATHLLSMVRAPDGALWVGSADEAILYRVDPRSGSARAVADFAGSEIKALTFSGGAVYAAVNDFDKKSGTAPARKPKLEGTALKPPEAGKPGAEAADTSGPRPGERKGKGALFRVEADGRTEQVHALADGYFQTLAAAGGVVYAGAGTGGRVYALGEHDEVQTAFDVEERQVNALVADGDALAFVTGDGAAVYTAAGPPQSGTYVSKVFDAAGPARWGKLRFAGTSVTLETRSGNTAKPDSAWSAWQGVGAPSAAGPSAKAGAIGSPPGRYLQFRARFGGAGSLERVAIFFLPHNLRPRITEVTFDDVAARANATLEEGVGKSRTPVVKVRWKVENPDSDELGYSLELRAEGDAVFRHLPTGATPAAPYTKTEFDWNTEGLPDGLYRVRVRVTDAAANPADLAQTDERVSEPFLVDNTRPVFNATDVSYPKVSGRATDGLSRLGAIAYSVDGGPWRMAYPQDGVFDDLSEAFGFTLPAGLSPGVHTLSLRVTDEAQNLGGTQLTFRVGR